MIEALRKHRNGKRKWLTFISPYRHFARWKEGGGEGEDAGLIVLIRSQIYGKIYGISLTYINIEAHYQRGEAEERGEGEGTSHESAGIWHKSKFPNSRSVWLLSKGQLRWGWSVPSESEMQWHQNQTTHFCKTTWNWTILLLFSKLLAQLPLCNFFGLLWLHNFKQLFPTHFYTDSLDS